MTLGCVLSQLIDEMIFNRLRHAEGFEDLSHVRVLDVFAGTGVFGLEALSRGACHAHFIESNTTTLKKITDFAQENDLTACTAFTGQDATLLSPCPQDPYHLCFIDAPYHQNLVSPALHALHNQRWLKPDCLCVIELDKQEIKAHQDIQGMTVFAVTHTRSKGRTHVLFVRYQPT